MFHFFLSFFLSLFFILVCCSILIVIFSQRLGRILRPKAQANPNGDFNAFFYTLVSTDTKEMYFSTKRQQYLVDQGYTFKVIQDLAMKADRVSEVLNTKEAELKLLRTVLTFDTESYDSTENKKLESEQRGEVEDDEAGAGAGAGGGPKRGVKRTSGSMSARSGAGGSYSEF